MSKKLSFIIRALNSTFCFSIFGAGGLFMMTFLLPLVYVVVRNPDKRRAAYVSLIQRSWRFFLWIMVSMRLIKVDIKGLERLSSLRSSIVTANHPSLIDVIIIVAHTPNPVCVVKGKLAHNFFVKYIVLSAYITNDENSDVFIRKCSDAIKAGYNIVIFPEGTRTTPGADMKLQRGFAYVALDTLCPLLPINIRMSANILGKNHKWYDVGNERIIYTLSVKEQLHTKDMIAADASRNINARKICDAVKNHIEK